MNSRQIILASRTHGLSSPDNFRFEDRETRNLNENEVLVKSWYMPVDPYMRGWMNDIKSFAATIPIVYGFDTLLMLSLFSLAGKTRGKYL